MHIQVLRPLHSLPLCIAVIVLLLHQASSLCYYPDEQLSDDLACDPTASVSACCTRGWTCLSNVNRMGGAIMYNCSSTEWCCDNNLVERGCCSDGSNLLKLGARQFQTTVGVAAASTSPTITSTSTQNSSQEATAATVSETASTQSPRSSAQTTSNSTSPATAATAASSKEPSSTIAPDSTLGVKIGAGVGVPLGVALIVAVVYISYLHGKHRKTRAEGPQMQLYDEYKQVGHMPATELDVLNGTTTHELGGKGRERPIAQLPGSGIER
ncbi:MAG: hypothetical protein Q9207_004601 [Kuettlingeria erythrocarpa]